MEEMKYTIKEANNEINRLTNLLNLYIDRKNLLFNETQPKVANPNAERVDGSMTREEKFFKYVYKCENEDIEWWIDHLNDYLISLSKNFSVVSFFFNLYSLGLTPFIFLNAFENASGSE